MSPERASFGPALPRLDLWGPLSKQDPANSTACRPLQGQTIETVPRPGGILANWRTGLHWEGRAAFESAQVADTQIHGLSVALSSYSRGDGNFVF